MIKEVHKVWCEWDIGQEYVVFLTLDKAIEWALESLDKSDIDDNFEDLLDQGLIGFDTLIVI